MSPDYSPLELVTDQDLIAELRRRSEASPSHGLIVCIGRPEEGSPNDCRGDLIASSQNPKMIQYLVGMICNRFSLRGLPSGQVEIPLPQSDGLPPGAEAERIETGPVSVADTTAWLQKQPGILTLPGPDQGARLYCLLEIEALATLLAPFGFVSRPRSLDAIDFVQDDHGVVVTWIRGAPIPRIVVNPEP